MIYQITSYTLFLCALLDLIAIAQTRFDSRYINFAKCAMFLLVLSRFRRWPATSVKYKKEWAVFSIFCGVARISHFAKRRAYSFLPPTSSAMRATKDPGESEFTFRGS